MADPARDHTVYLVHCTDAEGPLHESLEATFERLKDIFGLCLEPSRQTLEQLQRGQLNLNGLEQDVARVVDPRLISYNDTWDAIEAMLDRITAEPFRLALPDSDGEGWRYNWFCVDHVGYTINPRRKDLGYHRIFDRYRRRVEQAGGVDGLHFHVHPSHPSGASHRSATYYFHDLKFYQVLARRILDRGWFPSVHRAGFQTERPDSHWLLEQWIPFDLSNMACDDLPEAQHDLMGGVSGDWRRAPNDWVVYQPDHDDYQVPGRCRRYIARCLNLGTRFGLLTEAEVRKAFERARRHGATLLSFADHDFRDIGLNVVECQRLLRRVMPDYPDVRLRYAEAREAMHRVLFEAPEPLPARNLLSVALQDGPKAGTKWMTVEAGEPTFGPQPFLAIKTRDGRYHHDNFDFQTPWRRWTYYFQEDSFRWDEVAAIGVATNDRRGFAHMTRLDVAPAQDAADPVALEAGA